MKVAGAVVLFVVLSACVPWTVRPIQDGDSANSSAASLTPAAYVDSVWDAKLIPAILNSATDARALLDGLAASAGSGTQKYFTVKGSGRVVKVDTSSRNGLLMLDLTPFDGKPDLSIQIGPVIRGSALRDATGVIRFSDFTNQIAFADANNALNDRVLKTVLGRIDLKALVGHTRVEFVGAFGLDNRDIIPVQLKDDGAFR